MRYRNRKQRSLLWKLKKGPDGPIAPYLHSFAEYLHQQGYKRRYVLRQVWLAACFSNWLKQKRVGLGCIRSEHPARYLRYRHRDRHASTVDSPSLNHLMAFLREKSVIPQEKCSTPRPSPAERCVQAYEHYLRHDRALTQATITSYVPTIGDFLKQRFGGSAVRLSCLRAPDVVTYVQSQAQRLHVSCAKHMTAALRSFFRYAQMHGKVTRDLAAAVPIVAGWSMASVPRAIAPEQTRKLLASIDRRSAVGRRDYAMLLLLARLGLRAGEVASLELSDIDWDAGQLSVRGKCGRRTDIPLPADVGRAIAAYLRNGRPQCASRRVFLRANAPIGALHSGGGVVQMVRARLIRTGAATPTYGAHQFRHGLASDMLRGGASLAEIGAVLGHRDPDTTRMYTKIDLKALHTLAQPWPGEVR